MEKSKKISRPKVLLVVRAIVEKDDGQVLLIRRSLIDHFGAGKWELPGGKIDKGQDIDHAMEREVLEETGLLVIPKAKNFYVESEMLAEGPYKGFPYVTFVGLTKLVSGDVKLSNEHSEFMWLTTKAALDLELTAVARKSLLVLKNDAN